MGALRRPPSPQPNENLGRTKRSRSDQLPSSDDAPHPPKKGKNGRDIQIFQIEIIASIKLQSMALFLCFIGSAQSRSCIAYRDRYAIIAGTKLNEAVEMGQTSEPGGCLGSGPRLRRHETRA